MDELTKQQENPLFSKGVKRFVKVFLLIVAIFVLFVVYKGRYYFLSDFYSFTPKISQSIKVDQKGVVASFPVVHSHLGTYIFFISLPKITEDSFNKKYFLKRAELKMKIALEFYDNNNDLVQRVVSNNKAYTMPVRGELDGGKRVSYNGLALGSYRVPGLLFEKESYICNVVVLQEDEEINSYNPIFYYQRYSGE